MQGDRCGMNQTTGHGPAAVPVTAKARRRSPLPMGVGGTVGLDGPHVDGSGKRSEGGTWFGPTHTLPNKGCSA